MTLVRVLLHVHICTYLQAVKKMSDFGFRCVDAIFYARFTLFMEIRPHEFFKVFVLSYASDMSRCQYWDPKLFSSKINFRLKGNMVKP